MLCRLSATARLALVILLGVSCAREKITALPRKWPACHYARKVIATPSGSRLCAAHNIPLITVPGFTFTPRKGPPNVDHGGTSYYRAEACNPNHISDYQSLQKGDYTKPCKVTYCPVCERNLSAWSKQFEF